MDDDTRPVAYRVRRKMWECRRASKPSLKITSNSIMIAIVPTPLAHLLTDYKKFRNAPILRSYADAKNTTTHIVCTVKLNMPWQNKYCTRNHDWTLWDLLKWAFENKLQPLFWISALKSQLRIIKKIEQVLVVRDRTLILLIWRTSLHHCLYSIWNIAWI